MTSSPPKILTQMTAPQRSRLIGDIVTLMTRSDAHKMYKIHHFPELVLPPVELDQYRIYHDEHDNPVGFVSWAKLSESAEDTLLNKAEPLTFEDWASGEIIYLMEFIAPFGHTKHIVNDIRPLATKAHAIRFNPHTGAKQIDTFFGVKE